MPISDLANPKTKWELVRCTRATWDEKEESRAGILLPCGPEVVRTISGVWNNLADSRSNFGPPEKCLIQASNF